MGGAARAEGLSVSRDIALFVPTLRGGGAERNMLRLADDLASRGNRVTVIVADARGRYHHLIPTEVELVDLGVRFLPTSVVPLARWLRTHPVDVVLSAINGANVVALAARMLARAEVPIVVSERNALTQWMRDGFDPQRRWIIPWMVKRLYPRADAIVAVSQATAADLAGFLGIEPSDITVTGNPVVGRQLTHAMDEAIAGEWAEQLDGVRTVLSVGRLVDQKNHDQLVRAFASLIADGVDARLVLLGEGPRDAALAALCSALGISDHVVHVGFQPNPYPWMARADVVALTSRYEGLPTVIIEALACGARVVATDAPGGAAEILEGGRWGQLVPVDDVAATTRALRVALDAGRWPQPPAGALDRYTVDRVVDAHLAVIDPLLR